MRTFLIILLILVLLVAAFFVIVYPTMRQCNFVTSFNDGFNTSVLDTSKWADTYPSGNSGEQQYYSPDAIKIDNSVLNIEAAPVPSHGYSFTSGIILTKDKFAQKYGRFEIKAKLPKGQGFWPAFWLLPAKSDFPVEIDVFEMRGNDPHTIYMSVHWKGAGGSHEHTTVHYTSSADLSADFHTYTLEWIPDRLTWYLDGTKIYTTQDHVPHEPMFFLANLAVGGSFPGSPESTTAFPGIMQIQYARVYVQRCSLNLSH